VPRGALFAPSFPPAISPPEGVSSNRPHTAGDSSSIARGTADTAADSSDTASGMTVFEEGPWGG
jgi:hypothetical protein